jgi:hypothetical protein
MRKKHSKACERRKSELAEKRLMESLLCLFSDDVFCPSSKVPRWERISSVCSSCEHFGRLMRMMDEEDEKVMDEIDDIRRNPEKYGYMKG